MLNAVTSIVNLDQVQPNSYTDKRKSLLIPPVEQLGSVNPIQIKTMSINARDLLKINPNTNAYQWRMRKHNYPMSTSRMPSHEHPVISSSILNTTDIVHVIVPFTRESHLRGTTPTLKACPRNPLSMELVSSTPYFYPLCSSSCLGWPFIVHLSFFQSSSNGEFQGGG